jgi:hypothetical protein
MSLAPLGTLRHPAPACVERSRASPRRRWGLTYRPVMNVAPGPTRKTAAPAASLGRPTRPSGFIDSFARVSGKVASMLASACRLAPAQSRTSCRGRSRRSVGRRPSPIVAHLRASSRLRSRPALGRSGRAAQRPRPARASLRLVHRRLRNRRPEGCEGPP